MESKTEAPHLSKDAFPPRGLEELSVEAYLERMPSELHFVVKKGQAIPSGVCFVPDLFSLFLTLLCLTFTVPCMALCLAAPFIETKGAIAEIIVIALFTYPIAAVCGLFNWLIGKNLLGFFLYLVGRYKQGVFFTEKFYISREEKKETIAVCPWTAVRSVTLWTSVTRRRKSTTRRHGIAAMTHTGEEHQRLMDRSIASLIALFRAKQWMKAREITVKDNR